MNDNAEYDLLLRSMFDSCDSSGSGLLSTTEFEELCTHLCLEDQHSLLEHVLFADHCTPLSYDRFKECLLCLLEGTLTEDSLGRRAPSFVDHSTIVQHNRSGSAGLSASEEEYQNHYHGRINAIEVDVLPVTTQTSDLPGLSSTKRSATVSGYQSNVENNEWLLIDRENNIQDKGEDEESFRLNLPSVPQTMKKHRRYGRKSAPDLDLLESKTTWSHSNVSLYTSSPVPADRLRCDVTINPERQTVLPRTIAEELTGEGDGGNWITPEFVDGFVEESEDEFVEQERTSVDPQEALEAIWRDIIGDPEEKIDVEQLQHLYRSQSLTSSGGDVKQLFDVLDTDDDGLICFSDFARQMPTYTSDNAAIHDATYTLADFDSEDKSANESFESRTAHASTQSPADVIFSQPIPQDISDGVLQPTPAEPSFVLTDTTSNQVTRSHRLNNRNFEMSSPIENMKSPNTNVASSPITNVTSSPVSNDVNNSNSDDGMQRYHGVPSYRRKRRFSQHPPRRHTHRRRSSRTMSLPHHHPISIQHLEDCLLYFLTEENGRYVNMDEIRSIWKEEGIEDDEQVIKDLGIDLDDSFSIEVISDAFETAIKESVVHHAIHAVYKHGIKYHKAEQEKESSKRRKTESMLEHLNIQLQEQEERIEKMEVNHHERLAKAENNFKDELVRVSKQLDSLHSTNHKRSEEETEKLNLRIKELEKSEAKLLDELRETKNDNKQLLSRNHQMENELHSNEKKLAMLHSDLNLICRQTAQFNHIHTRQQSKMETLLQEYKEGNQLLQDSGDELLSQLDAMERTWNSLEKKTFAIMEPIPHHHRDATSSQREPTSDGLPFLPLPSGSRGFFSSLIDPNTSTPKRPCHNNGLPLSPTLLSEIKTYPRSGVS